MKEKTRKRSTTKQSTTKQSTTKQSSGNLGRDLQAKLDWYISRAGKAEYDEKAVESILYLLDRLAPVEESEAPDVDEAFGRFEKMVAERDGSADEAPGASEGNRAEEDAGATKGISAGADVTNIGMQKKKSKVSAFLAAHRKIAAAVLLILVLSLVSSTQIEAVKDSGFFFWLKRDETGNQMVTNPQNLDEDMYSGDAKRYYKREDLPEWIKEWVKMEEKVEIPGDFQWKCVDLEELEHFKSVTSVYGSESLHQELILGVMIFEGVESLNTEKFADYTYVESYEDGKTQIEVFQRQEVGATFYRICLWKENHIYYVQGEENLDDLKDFAAHYFGLFE